MSMKIALYQQKSKDGEGNSAHPGEPAVLGKDGRPKMVTQHEKHGDQMKRKGTDSLKSSVFSKLGLVLKDSGKMHGKDFLSDIGSAEKA